VSRIVSEFDRVWTSGHHDCILEF